MTTPPTRHVPTSIVTALLAAVPLVIPAVAMPSIATLILLLYGCGGGLQAGPVAPTPVFTPTSGPADSRVLLAGQSNAFGMRDCCMRQAVAFLSIASVQRWLTWPEFADAARNTDLIAFVWWQGGGDVLTPTDEYIAKLREVIAIARTANPDLPVRIVELPNLPDRAGVRAAQRVVAADRGVELIATADLTPVDGDGHYAPTSYEAVRDRIYRSLGR